MKTILIVLAVLILAAGGYYLYARQAPVDGANSPIEETSSQDRINIRAVCENALAFMTFPDATSAERFVAECEAGEHPEVIERYRTEMNFGDGAAI